MNDKMRNRLLDAIDFDMAIVDEELEKMSMKAIGDDITLKRYKSFKKLKEQLIGRATELLLCGDVDGK